MLTSSLQITIPLWQPLHQRVWRRGVEFTQTAWRGLLQSWRQHAQHVRSQRDWNALADLNAHTLKDIGAPDWVVRGAAERHDMAQRRLSEYGTWRGV